MNVTTTETTPTLESLRQHQLVIVRRLRRGPLTEFELAHEIADSSSYSEDEASEHMVKWLDELRAEGLIWAGMLYNDSGQQMSVAALTKKGWKLAR